MSWFDFQEITIGRPWAFTSLVHVLGSIIISFFFKYHHDDSLDLTDVSGYYGPGAFWAWIVSAIALFCSSEGQAYMLSPLPAHTLWEDDRELSLLKTRRRENGEDADHSGHNTRLMSELLALIIEGALKGSNGSIPFQALARDAINETKDACSHYCTAKVLLADKISQVIPAVPATNSSNNDLQSQQTSDPLSAEQDQATSRPEPDYCLDMFLLKCLHHEFTGLSAIVDIYESRTDDRPSGETAVQQGLGLFLRDFVRLEMASLVYRARMQKRQDYICLDAGTCGVVLYPLIACWSSIISTIQGKNWTGQDSAAANVAQVAMAMSAIAIGAHQFGDGYYSHARRIVWTVLSFSCLVMINLHVVKHASQVRSASYLPSIWSSQGWRDCILIFMLAGAQTCHFFQALGQRVWNVLRNGKPLNHVYDGLVEHQLYTAKGLFSNSLTSFRLFGSDHPSWRHDEYKRHALNLFMLVENYAFSIVFVVLSSIMWKSPRINPAPVCNLQSGLPIPSSAASLSDLDQAAALGTAIGALVCQYVYGSPLCNKVIQYLYQSCLSVWARGRRR